MVVKLKRELMVTTIIVVIQTEKRQSGVTLWTQRRDGNTVSQSRRKTKKRIQSHQLVRSLSQRKKTRSAQTSSFGLEVLDQSKLSEAAPFFAIITMFVKRLSSIRKTVSAGC